MTEDNERFRMVPMQEMVPATEFADALVDGDIVWFNTKILHGDQVSVTWSEVRKRGHTHTCPVRVTDTDPDGDCWQRQVMTVRTLGHWDHGFWEPVPQGVEKLAVERDRAEDEFGHGTLETNSPQRSDQTSLGDFCGGASA